MTWGWQGNGSVCALAEDTASKLAGYTDCPALHRLGLRLSFCKIKIMRRLSVIFLLLLASGCGEAKLETGYEPKRLDMPLSEREALYSDPYSQQAMQAQAEQKDSGGGSEVHRPGSP
jgi:hypothetical protein